MAELYEEFLADAAAAHKPRVVEKLENISNKSGSLLENLSAFSYDDSAARERTRQGLYSQTSLDADINYQTEQAKQLQFGVEGAQSIAEKMREARSNLDQKYRSNRTGGEAVKDSLLGITQGITNTIGGGVAFTAGLPSETVGLGISSAVDSVDSFLERNKSQYLRDQGDIYTAKQGLSAQDNKILSTEQGYEPDSFRESADRVIRDAVSAISNTTDSGALTANVASQGVGSLVGGVAVAKAIGASAIPIIGGKAAQVLANSKGKIEDALSAVGKAARTNNNRAMITSIGVSEGGSAYNQLTAQIMSKSHEELYGTSPYYTKLFDMTGDHEEAKRQTAHAAGRKLAAQVAPAAAVVAPLVSKFESTPFSGMLNKGLTNTGSQAGKEMIEEGYQGLAGKYLENRTTQEYIDPSKDLLEGLGEEVGQGMLGGVASVGAIRSPSIARAAVVGSVKTVGKGIGAVLGSSKESTKAKPLNPAVSKRALDDLAQAAPVVTQTFEDAVQSVPEEQKEATSSYLQNILDLGSFNEETFSTNKTLQTITLDSKNKFEAIEKLAQVAGDKEADQKTRLDAGLALMSIEADVNRVVDTSPDIFAELPDNHPAAQMANAVMGAVGSAFSIPEVANVVATVNEILSQEGAVPKVDEASHLTPEGQEAIQTNIQVAQYAPNRGDIENTRTILAQDSRGDITLTENQRTALRISMALLSAEKNRDMSKSILGEGALDTGKEITFEGGSKGLSITEHAMGVMRALNNKDVDRAKESLEDLGMFAQHMSNKVAALNTNIEKDGVGRETYQSWNQKAKKWFDSEEGLFLNTKSPTSIALAQEISHEAGLAIESYNNLIDATGIALDKLPLVQVNSNSVKQTLSTEPDVAFPDLQIPVEAYDDGSIQFDEDVQDESEVVPTVTTRPTKDTNTSVTKKKGVHEYTKEEESALAEVAEKQKAAAEAKVEAERVAALPKNIVEFKGNSGRVTTYSVRDTDGVLTTSRVLKDGTEKTLVSTGTAHAKVVNQYLINTTGEGSPPKIRKPRTGPRKKPDSNKDNLLAYITRMGGIPMNAKEDISGDTVGNYQVVGVNYLFNNTDKSKTVDELVPDLEAMGYIPPSLADDLAKKLWLENAIKEQLSADSTPIYATDSDAFNLQAEQELYARYESELEEATGEANPTLTKSIEAEKTSLELLLEESRRQHTSLEGVVYLEDQTDQTDQTDQRTSAAEDAKKSQEAERAAREAEPRLGVTKIISGGQTGGDIGGVRAGKQLGIETGGTLPNGWKTQDGSKPEYATEFGMTQDSSSSYVPRTMKNVDNADATIAVVWGKSVGTDKTIGYAQTGKWGYGVRETTIEGGHRPVLVITTKDPKVAAKQIREFVLDTGAKTLNIAGHREGSQPGIEAFTTKMLVDALDVNVEAKPEQAVTTEQEATPAVEEAKPVVTEAETAPLSGLASIFPNLLFAADAAKNVFLRTFKLPTEQRTNMFGEEAPLDRLREILGSGTSMAKFVGEKWRNKLDRTAQDAWEDYLNQGQELIYTVDDTVKAFLHNKRVNKKGVERESRMEYMARTGKDLNETEEGLLLNIMEEVTRTDEKGNEYASYALNKELTESATAAALNWLLNDAQNVTNYDAERVAKAMGISQMDVTPELIEYFNSGNMVTTSIEELGKKIQQYWGLSTEQNAYIGDQQGIVESLARELLSAMVKEGQLELSKGYELPILWGDTKYTPNKYVFVKTINNKEHSTALQKTASALEEIFLKDPEVSRYIGSDTKPTTATHQLRNPLAALTRQQRQALNTVQNSEYRIDPAMVGMYGMLGSKGMIELFNSDDQVDDNFNVNHQKSVIGQNKGIAGAFEDFATHLDEMQDIAEFENIPVSKVATRYKFEFSSVNRMQMQGKFTPQSSKYIREVMMTTWATLDLNDPTSKDNKNFYRGVAQALGIKIHKKDPSIWSSEYDKTVADLGLAIDMVEGLLRNVKEDNLLDQIPMESEDISKLKEYITKAGVDVSPLTLHAIVELARLRTSKDKSKFKTSLYLEADGMTNGPANAMMMLSGGIVSPEWVMNMERGGFYINQPDAYAGKKNSSGLLDMYEEAARILRDSIVGSENFTRNPNFVLYDLFTKDITLTKDDISIGRNLIKNPLTVSIYGSGLYGIAEKMTSTLIDSIYERMSEAQSAMSKDPNLSIELALFPNSAGDSQSAKLINAKRSYNDFLYSFGALIGKNIKGTVINPRTFTIGSASKALMVESIQKSVAKPMQNAITEVVGEEVMNNAESMRKAAAAMSVYASAIQRNMMDKQVALNKQRVAGYKQRQLITQKQLREVEKESTRVAALFGSKTQNYFINGDGEYAPNINTSVGLDGTGAMTGHIKGFGNAGVKAVAYMNISIDGQMMQNAFTSGAEVRHNQLTTFDGMQSPLSAVEEVGQQMNQAVWDSWNDNSTLTLGNRLAEFIEIMDLELLTPEDKLELSKVYAESPKKLTQPFDDAYLMSHIENNKKNLIDAGTEHAALMKVLGELNSTTDQMAGTDSPLVRNRDNSTFTSTDPEEIAEYIQEEVRKVLGNKTNQSDVGTILSDRIAKDVAKGKTPDGVYVITKQELGSLLGSSKITDDQKSIIREALNNKVLDDWKILVGNPKDIKNFVKDRAVGVDAFNTAMNKNYEGFTDPVNKLIVLLNGTGETLAHELTHASTYQKMVNFYSDPNSVTKEEAEAIQRTEALTDQFVSFDARTLDHLPGLQSTVSKVQDIIVSQLVQGNKAVALNEFMAWTLSNPDLAEQAKRTKASKLGRLVKDAWEAIKAIFGSKYLPRVSDDVYSNLRFNSTVLSANPQSVTEFVNNSTILAQDNNADRGVDLNGLKATYKKLITDVMDNRAKEYKDKGNPTYIAKEMVLAEEVSLNLRAAYFDMNPEEVGIFNTMVATFATEAPINSIAMAEANRLYTQVIDKLTPEMFMEDITDDQERYVANAKYDAILGKSFDKEDDYKRSTLLPAFLALGMVSKDFRDVISKIEAPLAKKSDAEGLNGAIENLGYKMITELGERLVGTNKATNVQQSVDILGEVIAREADKHESLVELGLNKAGGLTDKLNDYIVESAGVLSDRLLPNRTAEEKAAQSTGAKLVDGLRIGVAAAISEKNGKIVSEGVSDYLDKTEISEWMRNLMSDMFGRTEGNKDIWDMVKQFRSRIQVIRQGYRDDLPDVIRSMFSRELTKEEDGSVYRSMGKTELASLVMNGMSADEAINLASDSRARKDKINQIKSQLGNLESGSVVTKIDSKAKQLATFMNTKVAGNDLARNARTILLTSVGSNKLASAVDKSGNYEDSYNSLYGKTEALIDSLVTLYAVDGLSKNDLDTFKELSSTEKDGIAFTLSYLVGQVREERQSDSVAVKANAYKGYMPFEMKEDVSLRVDDDLNYDTLTEQGYVRLDAFTGSNIMPQRGMSYFYMPASAKAAFKQGIVQNVKQTKGGVDPVTGFSTGAIVKRYSNRSDIATIQRRIGRQKTDTPLLPVYDGYGVVVGYEQGISPEMAKRTTADEELMSSIGKWRGRQVEEYLAKISNEELVGKLKNTYEKDIETSPENAKKYVDLFKSTDPVIVDSVRLIPFETRKSIMAAFDGRFMVQRGMVKEVVGYRNASVGDFWTGNSRYSPELQNTAKRILVSIFGKDAYVKLMKGEQFIENVVNSAKDLIVTKSVIVPAINILSNILHAVSRGTPFRDIAKGYAKYTKEINTYLTSRQEYIVAEAKLRAATDRNEITKLNAILKSIDDSHRRMDIWPLIEAGEFTAVSSADSRYADVKLASGKITEYIEGAASKLPDGLNTAGKYLLVTKETALYNALQKSVEYGDFIAKAVYYEDLTKRLGVSKKEALGRVSEEYISYDHLPGRARGKLENLGLLWFYNFKLRSSKIALSTMRNNPVHTLLALNIPSPDMFGSTGIPVQDNVFTKLAEGSLGYSIGIGQGLNSIGLNPWYNLTR